MQFKPGDRVVCDGVHNVVAIVAALADEGRDIILLGFPGVYQSSRFRLADPPKPTRTVTIRGAFAIDAEGAYYIEDINGIGESFATSALEYARTRCFSPCIHSGYFRFDIEIPDPVEVVATVEEVK